MHTAFSPMNIFSDHGHDRHHPVLVELDDLNNISAELGPSTMEVFLSEFEFRVQQFAREHDEIVTIPPNKLCVLLRDVSDSQQIELAAAKLVRLFEEPITVLDQEFKPSSRLDAMQQPQKCGCASPSRDYAKHEPRSYLMSFGRS